MKAAVYKEFGKPLELTTVNDPIPENGDVVLKVNCTGICLSDWHGWMGHDPDISLPHIPGHEMAGTVVETGKKVRHWKAGDKVTLPFVCGCGHCIYCLEGNPQVCNHQFQPGFTHWGSFAPYVNIKYADYNLVRIPDFLDFRSAAVLGCRFATSFRAIVDQGNVKPDQWVAVHGCGGVGLSAIMIAHSFGARVIAVDLDNSRLQLAKELGAEHMLNASNQDSVESIHEYSQGGVHVSIDAVGKKYLVKQSINSLRKGGKHLQVGLLDPEESEVPVPFDVIIANELQLAGSHGMQASRYVDMIKLIEEGKLDPGKLITKEIRLSESLEALVNLSKKSNPGITLINDFTA